MDENYNGMPQQPDEGAQPTQKRPPVPEELGGTRVAPKEPAWHQAETQGASDAAASDPATGAHVAKEPRRHHPGVRAALLGVAGGVVGAAALTGVLLGTGVIGRTTATFTTGSNQPITINPSDNDTSTATAVAAKSLPSVVTVSCTYDSGEGLGSGVVLDTEGNIITNNHVIENADSITVTINGKSYDAELVGTDSSSDLAVVKADLQGDSVTPIEVGDSSALQVGDWVMSVGSPFGLEQSVSQGIVSALTRNELMQSSSGNTLYTNLIQVDAAINPGNSGGALFDSYGNVIGVVYAKSFSVSIEGIGYAIPVNNIKELVEQMINDPDSVKDQTKGSQIMLGITIRDITEEMSKQYSMPVGVYITEVSSMSAAERAGLQKGDIITEFAGETVTSADDLNAIKAKQTSGDTVSVKIDRNGKTLTLDLVVPQPTDVDTSSSK